MVLSAHADTSACVFYAFCVGTYQLNICMSLDYLAHVADFLAHVLICFSIWQGILETVDAEDLKRHMKMQAQPLFPFL